MYIHICDSVCVSVFHEWGYTFHEALYSLLPFDILVFLGLCLSVNNAAFHLSLYLSGVATDDWKTNLFSFSPLRVSFHWL